MNTKQTSVAPWALPAVLGVLFVLSLAWLTYANQQAGATAWQLVMNGLLLSVPLALLYVSIGLLVAAWRQKRSQGLIDTRLAKTIYRAPRIAGLLITLFVGLFALDVFSEGRPLGEMLLGFLIHALPAIVMAVLLALAWRWAWVGFAAFSLAAVYFLRFVFGNPLQGLAMLLLFSGPMAAIALLFWANWKWKKELRAQ